jgi:hypothetical protein
LYVDLDAASLNGVTLGQPFSALAFLGRDEDSSAARSNAFCYYSLGLVVDRGGDDALEGFSIVLRDSENRHRPFPGAFIWHKSNVNLTQMKLQDLVGTFGDWYWIDTDEDEAIVFYEFPEHEMQIECHLDGRLERVIMTRDPLMSSVEQRAAYGVTKPWPP